MLDLGPATGRLARLVRHVTDDQLTAATACEAYRLGDLLDHVDGLFRHPPSVPVAERIARAREAQSTPRTPH